jgi:hypothetical protein
MYGTRPTTVCVAAEDVNCHETVGLWRIDIVCVILCGCEIWCLTSRNEYKLRVCDRRVVRVFDWEGGSSKGM